MSRKARSLATLIAAAAVVVVVSACGTNQVGVPRIDPNYASDSAAAVLFNQRCAGCHTLSYAGAHGSGRNATQYVAINGPNFDVRCERPAIRILYAIENGGFSGAYMPQNVVVGKQAREIADFVARYAGQQAPLVPGVEPCSKKPMQLLPLTGPLHLSGS